MTFLYFNDHAFATSSAIFGSSQKTVELAADKNVWNATLERHLGCWVKFFNFAACMDLRTVAHAPPRRMALSCHSLPAIVVGLEGVFIL